VLLSQIGEFNFFWLRSAIQASIINEYGYQLALCVISLPLLTSLIWIGISKKWLRFEQSLIKTQANLELLYLANIRELYRFNWL